MSAPSPAGFRTGDLLPRAPEDDSPRRQATPHQPDQACQPDRSEEAEAPETWPDEWETWRVPDTDLETAYEATPAPERARIKSTLALVQALHHEQPALSEERVVPAGAGYGYMRRTVPAPWALLLLGPGAPSPVRVAAAIMPAHLAGVPLLGAMWTGGGRAPEALLAALELAGVEHVFAPSAPMDPAAALAAMRTWHGTAATPGRLLLLDAAPIPPDRLCLAERAAAVPVWTERPYPRIASRLTLAPGVDDLRAHPDLPPAFFRNTSITIFPASHAAAGISNISGAAGRRNP